MALATRFACPLVTSDSIIERQGGKDVFFHISAIQSDSLRTLREGQTVEFTVEQGPKGLQAVNIVFIK